MNLGTTTLIFKELTFEESLAKVKELGLDGFELYNPSFYNRIFKGTLSLKNENLSNLIATVESYGLKIISVNAGNNFVQPDQAMYKKQIYGIKECIDIAAEVGCNIVRVFGGEPIKGISPNKCLRFIIDGLKAVISYAEKRDIYLALENHGKITNNVDLLMTILDRVGSEHLKLNIDTGNFYWFGYKLSEVDDILKRLAPLAIHTHMKNGTTERKEERRRIGELKFTPLYEGDINLQNFIKLLKENNYKGAISIEDEFEGWTTLPLNEVMKVLKRDVEYLRGIMRNLNLG